MARVILLCLIFFKESTFDESALYGRWIWTESKGGLLASTTTAAETGIQKSMMFTKDHAVFYFAKDSITFKTLYVVENGVHVISSKTKPAIRLKNLKRGELIIENLMADTLIVRENSFDGQTHRYQRLR